MSKKKIKKINNLKNAESFLQINYIKGNKYVDKAGEFINELYDGEKEPLHALTPTGAVIQLNEKEEVKVGPLNLWIHFVNPDSLEIQKQRFIDIFEKVDSIFTPGKYTRIGWRIYFIFEYDETPKILSTDFYGGDFEEISFRKKIGDISLRINISKVVNNETNQNAIRFDIDFYKKLDAQDINITADLSEILVAIKSEELLDIINEIL